MRKYRDSFFQKVVEIAGDNDWKVTHRGFPDFLIQTKAGRFFLIKCVRRLEIEALRAQQFVFLNLLHDHGILIYLFDGENFMRFGKALGERHSRSIDL